MLKNTQTETLERHEMNSIIDLNKHYPENSDHYDIAELAAGNNDEAYLTIRVYDAAKDDDNKYHCATTKIFTAVERQVDEVLQ